ncbi:unnamed protein product [Gongylonema pulchrum]|uniref:NTP_transf_2 domain-containing protein n=1 Tax=Gongylonema pulchrum TaxID=637853 RepID=A0A183EG87_9BILA|nr:unnamed protein product [Gongylonema pulchrum]
MLTKIAPLSAGPSYRIPNRIFCDEIDAKLNEKSVQTHAHRKVAKKMDKEKQSYLEELVVEEKPARNEFVVEKEPTFRLTFQQTFPLYPQSSLVAFGSSINGCGAYNSDMDLCLCVGEQETPLQT